MTMDDVLTKWEQGVFDKGEKSGFDKGEKSGFDKGEKSGSDKKQIEIARRMIALQMMDDLIMQATGLSLAAIQKLREEA